jgi:hypothetical protein
MSDKIHYANPDETTFVGACFEFRFGAYGTTIVRVFQRPDCVDSALETAAEWLKEHEPGHLIAHGDPQLQELYEEASKERNCACAKAGEPWCDGCTEAAEADLTYTESGYLTSHEWTVDETSDDVFPEPRFDRFDICEAYASYWNAYHMGQHSDGYRDLCRALRLCDHQLKSFDDLSENGQAIYRKLVLADGR